MATYKSNKSKKKNGSSILIIIVLGVIALLAIRGLVGLVTGSGVENSSSQTPVTSDSQSSDSTPDSSSQENSSSEETNPKPAKNEFTTLVNVNHPLDSDFDVTTRAIAGTEKLFDVRAADDFEQMLADAKRAGYPIMVVSTYRTISYQQGLYNRKVQAYLNAGYDQRSAEEEAAKWVAIPGTSEHNTGLATDIVSSDWYTYNSDLEQSFEDTDTFKWLYEHCADYGFILRFPKGKESVTGIVYEPWHYRYVGKDVAKYIMENDLTLEEFWED